MLRSLRRVLSSFGFDGNKSVKHSRTTRSAASRRTGRTCRFERLDSRVPFAVELFDVPFKQQEQILFYILDRLPRFAGGAMDARGNGQYLAETARQRYGPNRILEVMLTPNWYRENFPRYKSAFEEHVLRIPDDPNVMEDHRQVKKVRGIPCIPDPNPGKQAKDQPKRHGDSAIAGLMAWHAQENLDGGPMEYRSVGKRRLARHEGAY